MRILFVMDPIKKLHAKWDNSLALLREFARRGHECWTADAPDLSRTRGYVAAQCRRVTVRGRRHYPLSRARCFDLKQFDLILIRKEPPVNARYLHMLRLLGRVAGRVSMVNHPRGIRNTNEKLSILKFPKWIPKTRVTKSPKAVLEFQKEIHKPVVVKPLDEKGGKGVFLLKQNSPSAWWRLARATQNGRKAVMVQEFIKAKRQGEKRVLILNGGVFAAYEKRARGKEFRANLGLGASFHRTSLSLRENKLVAALKPSLLKQGLYFVGIDVLEEKLIEINVTSPAGVTEAKFLYPRLPLVEAWADFLERFAPACQQARSGRGRSEAHCAGHSRETEAPLPSLP